MVIHTQDNKQLLSEHVSELGIAAKLEEEYSVFAVLKQGSSIILGDYVDLEEAKEAMKSLIRAWNHDSFHCMPEKGFFG